MCRVKGENFVEITYDNAAVDRIPTSGIDAEEVVRRVQAKLEEMEIAQKLKDAGLAGKPLVSPWQHRAGKQAGVGRGQFIPRQQ
jgi:hypothetical protein